MLMFIKARCLVISIFMLATIASGVDTAEDALPSQDNFIIDHTNRLEILKSLQVYKQQDLRLISVEKRRDMFSKIALLRHAPVVPTFFGEIIALPGRENYLVLFESPVYECHPGSGKWAFSVFDEKGVNVWPHIPWDGESGLIQAFDRNSIESVITTNCFQSGKPDTVCIQGQTGGIMRSANLKSYKVYFSLAPDGEQMLVTRMELDGELWYPGLNGDDGSMLMGLAIQRPFELKESELERSFKNATIPQILNRFIYLNSESLDGEVGSDLERLHKSIEMQAIVGRLTRHENLWVRKAANYYLIKFGDFSGAKKGDKDLGVTE